MRVIQDEEHAKSFQELISRIKQLIVTAPHCSRPTKSISDVRFKFTKRLKRFAEDVRRKLITLKKTAGSLTLN